MACKELQLSPLLHVADSHLLYKKDFISQKTCRQKVLWRSRNVIEGFSVKQCLLLDPDLCAELGNVPALCVLIQVKRHLSEGATGLEILEAGTEMALRGLVILKGVFQAAERKLMSYNMLYEVTQMMDSGPHPDCTKFPNVISHGVHFPISRQ